MSRKEGLKYFLTLAASLCVCLALGLEWERTLTIYPEGRDIVRAQSSGYEEEEADYAPTLSRTEKGVSQKISRKGNTLRAAYNFINFNKDRISVTFSLSRPDYKRYLAGYGYTDSEMAALRSWRKKAREEAWNKAYVTGGKAAAEKAIANIELDYETKMRGLFRLRGLALRKDNTVECDMPVIVKKNVKMMQGLALAIQKIAAQRSYGSEETTGAVLSLVQTALRYKIPPMVENGLHTGGLLPPARAMLSGWGDCDTKTALAASVLSSWNTAKMV
ncbi:MAG: hypothetical protein COT18_09215, partial [Elusimicrobia bacterium CG08_land_8_20_14_0_20_59_10]